MHLETELKKKQQCTAVPKKKQFTENDKVQYYRDLEE